MNVAILESTRSDHTLIARTGVEPAKQESKDKFIKYREYALKVVEHKKRVNLVVVVTLVAGVALLEEDRIKMRKDVEKLHNIVSVAVTNH